jgi:hypothetical protein
MLTRRSLIASALAAPAIIRPRKLLAQVRQRGFSHQGQQKAAGIPVLDRSHPLAQGLLFYGFDTGLGVIVDLVGNTAGKRLNSTAGNAVTQWGQGVSWNTSDAIYFPSSAAVRAATAGGGFSWACAHVPNTSLLMNCSPFGRAANNGGTQPFFNWAFDTAAGVNEMTAAFNNSGTAGYQPASGGVASTVNGFNSLLATAGVNGQSTLYQNGALSSQSATSAFNFASTNTNDDIIFGGISAAGSQDSYTGGCVFYGAFWNRVLSAAEAFRLHFDPYCFLIFPGDEFLRSGG